MGTSLPDAVERGIVVSLFSDAEKVHWENLNVVERSKRYRVWLTDEAVGGQLTQFMSLEEARVWIKDGPMKEYTRALNGFGKHADLIQNKRPSAAETVTRALGAGWVLESSAVKIKPLRVQARNGNVFITFAWGPARDLKHLVWAALQSRASGDQNDWVLCITAPFTNPTPKNVQKHDERIAESCGLSIVHLPI